MMQVMVNLLANAAKFSPPGSGRIVVQLEQVAAGWRVSVTDNGPGIPAADLEQVFEKFRQASAGGKKPHGDRSGSAYLQADHRTFRWSYLGGMRPGGGAPASLLSYLSGQGGPDGAVWLKPNHEPV